MAGATVPCRRRCAYASRRRAPTSGRASTRSASPSRCTTTSSCRSPTSPALDVEVAGEGADDVPHRRAATSSCGRCAPPSSALGGQPRGLGAASAPTASRTAAGSGSSAAAIVAGVLRRARARRRRRRAPARRCGAARSPRELEGHPDNVAACLLGGLHRRLDRRPAAVRARAPSVARVAGRPSCSCPTQRSRPRKARAAAARARCRTPTPPSPPVAAALLGGGAHRPPGPAARRHRGPAAPAVPAPRRCRGPRRSWTRLRAAGRARRRLRRRSDRAVLLATRSADERSSPAPRAGPRLQQPRGRICDGVAELVPARPRVARRSRGNTSWSRGRDRRRPRCYGERRTRRPSGRCSIVTPSVAVPILWRTSGGARAPWSPPPIEPGCVSPSRSSKDS